MLDKISLFFLIVIISFSTQVKAEERLSLEFDIASNWGLEHCIKPKEGKITYSFTSPKTVIFGTHSHSDTKTTHQIKELEASSFQSEAPIEKGRTFCWTWRKSIQQTYEKNFSISLDYIRINAQ